MPVTARVKHPTQALLDLYTIQSEIGHLDDLHVVMVGDLSHGEPSTPWPTCWPCIGA